MDRLLKHTGFGWDDDDKMIKASKRKLGGSHIGKLKHINFEILLYHTVEKWTYNKLTNCRRTRIFKNTETKCGLVG